MQNKELKQVLNSKTKLAEKASGVLSKLFRQIMDEQKFNQTIWDRNMLRYLKDPRNRIPQNSRDMSSARGNLSKELLRPTMTWGVFEKAIRFLNPFRVRLKLEFEWKTGIKTEYSAVIYVNNKSDPIEEESTIPVDHPGVQFANLAQSIKNIQAMANIKSPEEVVLDNIQKTVAEIETLAKE